MRGGCRFWNAQDLSGALPNSSGRLHAPGHLAAGSRCRGARSDRKRYLQTYGCMRAPFRIWAIKGDGLVAHLLADQLRRATVLLSEQEWKGSPKRRLQQHEAAFRNPPDDNIARGCRPVRARPVPPPSGAVRPPLLGPPARTHRGSTARAGSVRGLLSCAVLYCNRHASDTGRSASPVPGRPFRVASALRTVAPSPDRLGDYRVATSLGTRSRCAWGSSGINRLQPGDFSRYSKWTVSRFSQK